MTACERCWADARARVMFRGGDLSERYHEVMREREEDHLAGRAPICTPEQQCGEIHAVPWGKTACRCGAKTVDVAPVPDGAP